MIKFIDKIISEFRTCFKRKAAFEWFAVILVAIMTRSDNLGLTSVIRDLSISKRLYPTMMNFFRSSAWSVECIFEKWCEILLNNAPLLRYNDGSVILVGDGTKISKEARRMPGVKKHHQDSENSGKPSYIFGHLFGCIGVLASNTDKTLCIPMFMNIEDGVDYIRKLKNPDKNVGSHIEQIADNACKAASIVGKAILLLDRYFLSEVMLCKINEWNLSFPDKCIRIVTKAKSNVVAYTKPNNVSGRGRPRKKGDTIHLKDMFSNSELFENMKVYMYGKEETVKYYAINLLWKQGLYQELRFVLIMHNGAKTILVTTDLSMPAEAVIRLYAHRFKIECSFKTMKQLIGVGCYHFWSKHMPKLNRYNSAKEQVIDEQAKPRIIGALEAIEKYVMICCIATGVLQITLLTHNGIIDRNKLIYRRTVSKNTVSESVLADYLRKNLFRFMLLCPDLSINRFIQAKQASDCLYSDAVSA